MTEVSKPLSPLQLAARKHAAADMLLQNVYSTTSPTGKFKGCSVGCLARDIALSKGISEFVPSTHIPVLLNEVYGIPEWWVDIQDDIFEEIAELDDAIKWHIWCSDFITAYADIGDWDVLQGTIFRKFLITHSESFIPPIKTRIPEILKAFDDNDLDMENLDDFINDSLQKLRQHDRNIYQTSWASVELSRESLACLIGLTKLESRSSLNTRRPMEMITRVYLRFTTMTEFLNLIYESVGDSFWQTFPKFDLKG